METLTPAPLTCAAGLPTYLATPSCRSVSNHVGLPDHRLPPRQRDQRVSDFAMYEQARRSSPPNRVRPPTDRPFALGCSPPRLAATQLPSATEFVASSDTDFHRAVVAPSWAHSFPRTRVGGFTFQVQELVAEHLCRSFVVKALSRSVIIGTDQTEQAVVGQRSQVGLPRQSSAQAADGVFNTTFLPRGMGITEKGAHG